MTMYMGQGPFDTTHFLKAAFGGAVCCSVTHGGTTPIDVLKTRMQLDPAKYPSLMGAFRDVHANEGGWGALFNGAMPTAQGYFVQGWFKFGGVEIFKLKFAQSMSEQDAFNSRTAITLGAAACAECIADIFLCPYEAVRIRGVSDPTYAPGMVSCAQKMISEMGVIPAFYSGLGPILFKQVPYTMAKFVVQQQVAERMYKSLGSDPSSMSKSGVLGVSLSSGVVAGVAAATISQPADGLLSKINKKGAGGEGSMVVRLGRLAAETGIVKLCTQGLFARWLHVGTITAGQFGIVDACMMAVGAQRFHFHDPSKQKH